MSVVEFRPKVIPKCDEPEAPHLSGRACCSKCVHEWEAVAPVGVSTLECPKCKSWWGYFKSAIEPSGPVWHCTCGHHLFWLRPDGAMCRGCGKINTDWAQ